MTTNIRVKIAEDLLVSNEVINFRKKPAKSLAGISWLTNEPMRLNGVSYVLGEVAQLVKKKKPDLQLWLLVGTSAWQPDTRIVRHHKLWGALKARGLRVPGEKQLVPEVIVESSGKLKLYGAAKLTNYIVDDVAHILLNERCSYLAAIPGDLPVQEFLNIGWSGDPIEDATIMNFLSESGALLLKPVGEFDDIDKGVVLVGPPTVVRNLMV